MKTLAITGGTGGLGGAVVERLSREYQCVVLSRPSFDLADEASVIAGFERIGDIYGLVHLAGGFAAGSVAETSTATWTHMLELNLTGAFFAIRAALPHLTRPGRIVAVSSLASLAPSRGLAAYAASKAALNMLVQSVAAEHAGTGLTANAILPSALATPAMLRETKDASKLVPLERVAETIAFLLSEAAASITGALVPMK